MTVAARAARRKKPGPVVQAGDLLAWYDRNRRILPWRATGRAKSDPYRVWLSEIMLQQTTVKTVAPYYARFLQRWPDVEALASAPLNDVLKAWAGLGYYARARNLHVCAKAVVERHAGEFPPDQIALRALPGIGPYTAAAIAAIAFDIPAVPVDGNVERVVSRLFAVEAELPAAKGEFQALAATLATPYRAGDFAQALMDLGSGICTPKKPACVLCPWTDGCAARRRGDAETFPRKTPKVEGRLRKGSAFVAVRADGAVLLRARPMKGLLGGMTEVPTSEWSHDFIERKPAKSAPHFQTAAWRRLRGAVTLVFTHFPLQLAVYRAELPKGTRAPKGTRFVPARELHGEALPNLMRKVIAHALEHANEIKPKKRGNK
ncbi:MAG: A/G-specific adenine glycosylase [Hyphomicrobiales bacterium]